MDLLDQKVKLELLDPRYNWCQIDGLSVCATGGLDGSH